MKKALCLLIVSVVLFCFSSCSKNTVIDDNQTLPENYSNEVFTLQSDENTITVKDGTNYILFTMSDGKVTKARYAYRFGDNKVASEMYSYYEKNGYDPKFSGGELDRIYLIMTYKDQSKYVGMTEDQLKTEYGDKIVNGYFESESATA